MSLKAIAKPAASLLSPTNHALVLIDHQAQMAFNTKSIDITNLRANAGILAHTGKGFNVPTIISTISKDSFAGPLFDEITEAFPDAEVTDRTTSNAWEDTRCGPAFVIAYLFKHSFELWLRRAVSKTGYS